MNKVWIGKIPDVLGYGMFVIGKTKKDVYKSLKNEWNNYKYRRGSDFESFEDLTDYYGICVEQVNFNEVSYEIL